MSYRIGLAQCGFPGEGGVLPMIERFVSDAASHGCSLVVFPENLMCPRDLSASELFDLAQPVDGEFVSAVGDIARRCGIWVVGTTFERTPDGRAPYNTAFVVDDGGSVELTYRKCHLYDAHGVRESDRMTPGDSLDAVIRTPFATVGVGICYDLRFPEHARALALAGCDLVVYPACWYDGPNKAEHWTTLLRARAIENELFVAGTCRAGKQYVGRSSVYGPLGDLLAQGAAGSDPDEGGALVVCEIDPAAVSSARDAMPVLDHRRPDLYAAHLLKAGIEGGRP